MDGIGISDVILHTVGFVLVLEDLSLHCAHSREHKGVQSTKYILLVGSTHSKADFD